VLKYRVLREIFARKKDEVTEEKRRLQNEELNDQYYLTNNAGMIKAETMR
jgi:hypothetical protein